MLNRRILLAFLFGLCAIGGARAQVSGDPLPSWNDGAVKKSITDFVVRVTAPDGADFVPAEQRIATFDNDGTLWCEQPIYFQFAFALDRIRAMAQPSSPLSSTSDSNAGPSPGRGPMPVTCTKTATTIGRPASSASVTQVRGRRTSLPSSTRSIAGLVRLAGWGGGDGSGFGAVLGVELEPGGGELEVLEQLEDGGGDELFGTDDGPRIGLLAPLL